MSTLYFVYLVVVVVVVVVVNTNDLRLGLNNSPELERFYHGLGLTVLGFGSNIGASIITNTIFYFFLGGGPYFMGTKTLF